CGIAIIPGVARMSNFRCDSRRCVRRHGRGVWCEGARGGVAHCAPPGQSRSSPSGPMTSTTTNREKHKESAIGRKRCDRTGPEGFDSSFYLLTHAIV
ncbi:hypothetical protein JI435_410550, partial [Parastagonospora nodorum SN15]